MTMNRRRTDPVIDATAWNVIVAPPGRGTMALAFISEAKAVAYLDRLSLNLLCQGAYMVPPAHGV